MFTSTWPRLEFRPIITFFWRIMYSKSRPSSRAMAVGAGSCAHCTFEGDGGADLRERSVQASLSELRDIWVWAISDAFTNITNVHTRGAHPRRDSTSQTLCASTRISGTCRIRVPSTIWGYWWNAHAQSFGLYGKQELYKSHHHVIKLYTYT